MDTPNADYELVQLGWHGRWLRYRVPGSVLEVVARWFPGLLWLRVRTFECYGDVGQSASRGAVRALGRDAVQHRGVDGIDAALRPAALPAAKTRNMGRT